MWIQKVPGGGVEAITYSLDGRTLYVLDRGQILTVWDVATRAGRRFRSRTTFGYSSAIYPLADGRLVGVGGGIAVWDSVRGETEFGPIPEWPNDSVYVTPDGCVYLLTATGRKITGIDLNRNKPLPPRAIPGKTFARRFAFTPNEKSVAVCFNEIPTVVYECGKNLKLRTVVELADAWDVQFSPSGSALALANRTTVDGTNPNPTSSFWDTATWKPCAQNVPCWISDAGFAMNPVLPVFATVIRGVLSLCSLQTGEVLRSLDFALGKYVQSVCFSPDGLTCAVGGSNRQFAVFDVDV